MRALSLLLASTSFWISFVVTANSERATFAVYMSGQELTTDCRVFLKLRQSGGLASMTDAFNAGECYGFVVGILDKSNADFNTTVVSHEGVTPSFCPGDTVNANDATEVVARYTDEHPENRSLAGYFLAAQALAKAYPCLH